MIVFPMAGMSRRFTEAGYEVPKYMLLAHGKSLFEHAVEGFYKYFNSQKFVFVIRDISGTLEFVKNKCINLGILDFHIVTLDAPTAGQAETVAFGLKKLNITADESVTIFNIDTFRPEFEFPNSFHLSSVDGYLEVIIGSGDNWSYVKPDKNRDGYVLETAEKNQISNLCCTGIYYFSSVQLYLNVYERFASGGAKLMGLRELYVAPMYNYIIQDGGIVRYNLIDSSEVVFCGVPSEYKDFLLRGR